MNRMKYIKKTLVKPVKSFFFSFFFEPMSLLILLIIPNKLTPLCFFFKHVGDNIKHIVYLAIEANQTKINRFVSSFLRT